MALLALAAYPGDASASTKTWIAGLGNVGSLGSNGSAVLSSYWTGSGRLQLDLRSLRPGGLYRVVLFRGPDVTYGTSWGARGWLCDAVSDGTLVTFAGTRAGTDGRLRRSLALSPRALAILLRHPMNLAIKMGEGSRARCGGFAPQRQARPSSSPVQSPSPGVGPTPTPLPTDAVACGPWPSDAEEVLTVLTTPPDLCLRIYPDPSVAPAYVRATGAFYSQASTAGQRPTIDYIQGTRAGSEGFVLAHELCHAHQDRVAQDFGGRFGDGWYASPPGAAFIAATGWEERDGRWISPDGTAYLNPIEDNADTCATWFDPDAGPKSLRRWQPERFAWAQRWLPLPAWITPWVPPAPTPDRER